MQDNVLQPVLDNNLKVALVHDYFNQNGGAEKVMDNLLEMYPHADLYTATFIPENFKNDPNLLRAYQDGRVKTTILDKLFLKNGKKTKALNYFKHLFFIYPIIMSFVKVKNYDLVIISSTYCGKNIRTENCKKLVHYCHSPVRFLHGLVTETDHATLSWFQNLVINIFKPLLKFLDLRAVAHLNSQNCLWIGNSKFIKKTVDQVYGVSSLVLFPPVDLDKYLPIVKNENPSEEFYLCHGRISFHKRIDLAISACLQLNRKLYISGSSALESDMDSLRALVPEAKKELIVFLGRTTDEQLYKLISEAKAMLFPGKEDAGISPIEMLAGGLPVIAYGAGGALEYVVEGQNGVFFYQQKTDALANAIKHFELSTFDTSKIKDSSKQFSKETFEQKFRSIVASI
jgi:glycosyltransferase involved in cell wall biosynthesis